jgi:hypothetical protein
MSDAFSNFAVDTDFDAPPQAEPSMRGRLSNAIDASRYILAGKSTVTLVSKKTGARFTYRISVSDDGACHFVALLSGPNNGADYKYLGRISRGIFWLGRKVPRADDISRDAPSARAFEWTWKRLARQVLPDDLEVWHEGSCGRCGRTLTVPSSVERGFGPECATKI